LFFIAPGHTKAQFICMASLYLRKDIYWIKYRIGSHSLRESTGIRKDSPNCKTRLRVILAKKGMEEAIESSAPSRAHTDEWVSPWLLTRYRDTPETLKRYSVAWSVLQSFAASRRRPLACLADWTRADCMDFVAWRTAPIKRGQRTPTDRRAPAAQNSAIHELRVLRLICSEAMERGLLVKNPASRLRLKLTITKPPRREISPKDHEKILSLLDSAPDWMRVSYLIATAQGCRLRETSLPLDQIVRGTITFRIKRGRLHTTALNPELLPLIEGLRASGQTHTWHWKTCASRDWSRWFRRHDLPYSFHSTRVTAITRLARAGVNLQQAMRFIGHTTGDVHRIYQRLGCDDLSAATSALSLTLAPA
jgi:integrase